jgi:superfamily II DNA/RNA helicase
MFSDRFPEDIHHLAEEFLHNYLFLTVSVVRGTWSDVEQRFHLVTNREKRSKLMELISQGGWLHNLHLAVLIKMVFRLCYHYVIFTGGEKTLVFVETKCMADFLASYLSEHAFCTTSIHEDRTQQECDLALCDFETGCMIVLVTTSFAACWFGNANTQFVSCQSRAALDARAICRKSIFADNKIVIIRTAEYYKV